MYDAFDEAQGEQRCVSDRGLLSHTAHQGRWSRRHVRAQYVPDRALRDSVLQAGQEEARGVIGHQRRPPEGRHRVSGGPVVSIETDMRNPDKVLIVLVAIRRSPIVRFRFLIARCKTLKGDDILKIHGLTITNLYKTTGIGYGKR